MLQARPGRALAVNLQVRGGGKRGWMGCRELQLLFGVLTCGWFLQAEARGRLATRRLPGVVDAAASGDAEAVELHVIADAGAVNVLDRLPKPPVHCSPCPRGAAADDGCNADDAALRCSVVALASSSFVQ